MVNGRVQRSRAACWAKTSTPLLQRKQCKRVKTNSSELLFAQACARAAVVCRVGIRLWCWLCGLLKLIQCQQIVGLRYPGLDLSLGCCELDLKAVACMGLLVMVCSKQDMLLDFLEAV